MKCREPFETVVNPLFCLLVFLGGELSSHVSVPVCQTSVGRLMPDIDTFSFSYMPADVMSAVMEVGF